MLIERIKGRNNLIAYIANMQPCMIAIEACGGDHYWARKFMSIGHQVKMMVPQFVKSYVMSNKNDGNDAKGITEAATRPNMKFIPVKTIFFILFSMSEKIEGTNNIAPRFFSHILSVHAEVR